MLECTTQIVQCTGKLISATSQSTVSGVYPYLCCSVRDGERSPVSSSFHLVSHDICLFGIFLDNVNIFQIDI